MINKLALLCLLAGLACGCAAPTGRMPTMADMDVVAKNVDFALVRLKPGQDYGALAHVFLGHRSESWQIREVNARATGRAGQVVAVPLRAINPSSVYGNGYRTLPILCYHQFTARGKASHQLELSASQFEKQIRYLIDNDFRLLSFEQVQSILHSGNPIPEKSVVISIDDGYRSVYDVAWPILKKYEIPATLFIYPDFIGAPAALSWEQLREMAASGHIEVESHGLTHSSLARQADDKSNSAYKARLHTEISGAKKIIERKMGEPTRFLSYPYGERSVATEKVAQAEGVKLAATVTRGDNTVFSYPYLLHRSMIYDKHSMSDFKKMLRVFREKDLK